MTYTTRQLAKITQSELIGNPNLPVKNIAFDSRNIFSSKEMAFIAIRTQKNSGEKYIKSAIEKGVEVVICQKKPEETFGATYIITENSIAFLQKLARYHLSQFGGLKTIGITGSNGKTMVKEWLYQCLNDEFNIVKSPKSFNSQIGLPISLLQIDDRHNLGIFEVGISQPEEMKVLEEVFSPKIGILTNIGTAHLINFRDENHLIDEKITLFKNSEIILFNGDNERVLAKIKALYSDKKLISYGLKSTNDVKIISDWKNRNKEVKMSYFGEHINLPVHQRDEATLSNVLCVVALMKELGIENSKILKKVENLKSVEMRLESVEGLRNNLIINDSYNLDLDSLNIAYQFINEYNKAHKVLILTSFAETKNDDKFYEQVARLTNEQKFDKIFLIGKEISNYKHLFSAETLSFDNTEQIVSNQILHTIENSLILLKGARKFRIDKLKLSLELQKHDTVLEINLNSILHNINVHKAVLKPETKMMAMVKAFSYGLGGYEIAEFLQHHHIDYLTVAYADEGADLRKHGISTPIMVMNPEQHSHNAIIEYNLEPEIYSFRVLDMFCEQLKIKGYNGKYPIHIKLETGMHRLGFKGDEIDYLIERLNSLPVKVQSVFTHLATADMPEERDYALGQIKIFDENSSKLVEGLDYKPLRHILNSPGIANFSEYQFDMVRIGIGMIGFSANEEIQKQLQNAVSFKTVISQISIVRKGETIGYSRKFKAEEDCYIATIPVGYADGLPRLLGNGVGRVKINGSYAPIVGNVCMDMMMVNLGNIPAKEGDVVSIFDSLDELLYFSEKCQTIPYEVLTSISRRVKRVYVKN